MFKIPAGLGFTGREPEARPDPNKIFNLIKYIFINEMKTRTHALSHTHTRSKQLN